MLWDSFANQASDIVIGFQSLTEVGGVVGSVIKVFATRVPANAAAISGSSHPDISPPIFTR